MTGISITKAELQLALSDGLLPRKIADLQFDTLGQAGTVLADVHNEGLQDVVTYFETLDWSELSNRDQIRVARVLESFLGAVRDTSERITESIHAIRGRISGIHAHYVDTGFESWTAANPRQVSEVANLIDDLNWDSPFLNTLLRAWRGTATVDALNATISFSRSEWSGVRRQSVFALAEFTYNDENPERIAEDRLIELLSSDDVNDQRNAIGAISRALDNQHNKSTRLVAALESISLQANVDIRHELIASLAFLDNPYPPNLRRRILSLMGGVRSKDRETLKLIDVALYKLDMDTDREIAFDVLTNILSQETNAPTFKNFISITHKIQTAAHWVSGWYTIRWLLDGHYVICDQIDSLFPPLDKSTYEFELNEMSLSDEEVFYLVRKVYAYLMFSHGPATSVLCACLMSLKFKQRKLLEQDIASFWLRNFPSDLELFDAVSRDFPRRGLRASIKRMRKQVEAYQKPLRSLPTNPALRPSTMERRIQSEIAHERNKEINRIADESSLLASLFHKSTLLYGRSSVTYIHAGGSDEPIRQVIPLQRHQTSSELPHMDALHPTHLRYLLFQFRRERRPK